MAVEVPFNQDLLNFSVSLDTETKSLDLAAAGKKGTISGPDQSHDWSYVRYQESGQWKWHFAMESADSVNSFEYLGENYERFKKPRGSRAKTTTV